MGRQGNICLPFCYLSPIRYTDYISHLLLRQFVIVANVLEIFGCIADLWESNFCHYSTSSLLIAK